MEVQDMVNLTRTKKLIITLAAAAVSSLLIGMTAQATTYKVIPGDTLYKLGNVFNTSASVIMKQSNLTSSGLYPGQVLTIPGDVYTVKSGDTLFLIAKRYGISLYSLERVNNNWDGYIYPGLRLNLPGIITGSAQTVTNPGVIPYTQSDVDLLARLIMSEAEGEPYSAKVAVGAVVVNRVQSNQFADTIKGVVYQRINGYYQFSPVLNGAINKPASPECVKAAYDALKGTDPAKGAMFYFDDSATNTWLRAKTVSVVIDKLIFSY